MCRYLTLSLLHQQDSAHPLFRPILQPQQGFHTVGGEIDDPEGKKRKCFRRLSKCSALKMRGYDGIDSVPGSLWDINKELRKEGKKKERGTDKR